MTVYLIEFGKRGAKSACEPHCALRCVQIFGDDRELIATETSHQVDFAHGRLQARRDLLKQRIAGWMAQRIIDILEAIEIEAENGHQLIVPAGPCDGAVEMLAKLHTIGESGQRMCSAR